MEELRNERFDGGADHVQAIILSSTIISKSCTHIVRINHSVPFWFQDSWNYGHVFTEFGGMAVLKQKKSEAKKSVRSQRGMAILSKMYNKKYRLTNSRSLEEKYPFIQ